MNVIENPEVAQALKQDKNQNLTYLKEHYGVRDIVYGTLPLLILDYRGSGYLGTNKRFV